MSQRQAILAAPIWSCRHASWQMRGHQTMLYGDQPCRQEVCAVCSSFKKEPYSSSLQRACSCPEDCKQSPVPSFNYKPPEHFCCSAAADGAQQASLDLQGNGTMQSLGSDISPITLSVENVDQNILRVKMGANGRFEVPGSSLPEHRAR